MNEQKRLKTLIKLQKHYQSNAPLTEEDRERLHDVTSQIAELSCIKSQPNVTDQSKASKFFKMALIGFLVSRPLLLLNVYSNQPADIRTAINIIDLGTSILLVLSLVWITIVYTSKNSGKAASLKIHVLNKPYGFSIKLGLSLIVLACLFPPRLLVYPNGYTYEIQPRFQFIIDSTSQYSNIGRLSIDYNLLILEIFVLLLAFIVAPYLIRRLGK